MSTIELQAVMFGDEVQGEQTFDLGEMVIEFPSNVLQFAYDYYDDDYSIEPSVLPTSISVGDISMDRSSYSETLHVGVLKIELGSLSTSLVDIYDWGLGKSGGFASVGGFNLAQFVELGDSAMSEFMELSEGRASRLSTNEFLGPNRIERVSSFATPEDIDIVSGTDGKNRLVGSNGADVIVGLGGSDKIIGRGGADVVMAGTGNDKVIGGAGHDFLSGYDGRDRLLGGTGNDEMDGGTGSDYLSGGAGRDTLEGGDGNDKLIGGKSADTFVFNLYDDTGSDLITDFGRGADRLELRGMDSMNHEQFIATYVHETDDGLWVDFGDGNGVMLRGVEDSASLIGHIDFIG